MPYLDLPAVQASLKLVINLIWNHGALSPIHPMRVLLVVLLQTRVILQLNSTLVSP